MEAETTKADKKIAQVRNDEDIVMLMLHAVMDAFQSKVEKQEVGHRIDDFGRVLRGIVVLQSVRRKWAATLRSGAYFFTPIDG